MKLSHLVTGYRGYTSHPLYRLWWAMLRRCLDPEFPDFNLYGGRGITVDPVWFNFKVFTVDMGSRPSTTHQLDRINNDAGYTPSNCRWVTPTQNITNSGPRNGRKYKGVYRDKSRTGKFFAMITLNKKPKYIGSYFTQEDAARAWNEAMIEHYGEGYLRLNLLGEAI